MRSSEGFSSKLSCRDTDLDGETRIRAFTALVTVDPVIEGVDDRRVRSEGQVMIRPLAKDCHQVSVEWVTVHILIFCVHKTVGHFSHLWSEAFWFVHTYVNLIENGLNVMRFTSGGEYFFFAFVGPLG